MKNAIAVLFMLISISFICGPARAAAPGDYLFQWGSEYYLYEPYGMATDSSGNVYVADSLNNRILKYDSSGTFIMQWGTFGSGNGQFQVPKGMAVDGSSGAVYVYVVDCYNSRIQKFDSSGNYITQWATTSMANDEPFGVAVDGSGNVYVAAPLSHRILKYDSSGTFITQWGTFGAGNGQFNLPVAVAVYGSGDSVSVYVSDQNNYRIQEFDGAGNYIRQWGVGDSQSYYVPGGLAVYAKSGNLYIYVTVSNNGGGASVQKFDGAGNFIAQWGSDGCVQGQFKNPWNVAVDGNSGSVYVTDSILYRIQKFDSSGNYITKWGWSYDPNYDCRPGPTFIFGNGGLASPDGVAVDADGNVYVADVDDNRIQIFDSSGNYISQFGSYISSDTPGSFYHPRGVAVDAGKNIYVADENVIQKFDSAGNYITQWGCGSSIDLGPYTPNGVAVTGGSGAVYVYVVIWQGIIQKYDSSGNFITQWGSAGTGDGQFNLPRGIAVDKSNNVYVADTNNNRVQKFDSSGNYITQWGSYGSGDGQFWGLAWGIAVDGSGNVYVTDPDNRRVQVFDNMGTFKGAWGSLGFGNGLFGSPSGIAANATGTIVYVADNTDNRIQAFTGYGVFNITSMVSAGNGTISCTSPVNPGASSICTISAIAGNHLSALSDNGVDTLASVSGNSFTMTNVTTNHTVVAGFSVNTYNLAFIAGAGGGLNGATSQKVNYGASAASVTAAPNAGYHFVNWTGTAGFTSIANPLTVNNVTSDLNITANFAVNPVDGVCGTANGQAFTSAPIANLCSTGTASAVSGAGPWNWSCSGQNGGQAANCSANKVPHDGIINPADNKIVPDIGDALTALRFAVGLINLTEAQQLHGDVAPLGLDGKPLGNGVVDLGDALIILRYAVGVIHW